LTDAMIVLGKAGMSTGQKPTLGKGARAAMPPAMVTKNRPNPPLGINAIACRGLA